MKSNDQQNRYRECPPPRVDFERYLISSQSVSDSKPTPLRYQYLTFSSLVCNNIRTRYFGHRICSTMDGRWRSPHSSRLRSSLYIQNRLACQCVDWLPSKQRQHLSRSTTNHLILDPQWHWRRSQFPGTNYAYSSHD